MFRSYVVISLSIPASPTVSSIDTKPLTFVLTFHPVSKIYINSTILHCIE